MASARVLLTIAILLVELSLGRVPLGAQEDSTVPGLFSMVDDVRAATEGNCNNGEGWADFLWIEFGFDPDQNQGQPNRLVKGEVSTSQEFLNLGGRSSDGLMVSLALRVCDLFDSPMRAIRIKAKVDSVAFCRVYGGSNWPEKVLVFPINLEVYAIYDGNVGFIPSNEITQENFLRGVGLFKCPTLKNHVETRECFGAFALYDVGQSRYRYVSGKLALNSWEPCCKIVRDFGASRGSCHIKSRQQNAPLHEEGLCRLSVISWWAFSLADRESFSVCCGHNPIRCDNYDDCCRKRNQGNPQDCNARAKHSFVYW